jgi:hypothetical protein
MNGKIAVVVTLTTAWCLAAARAQAEKAADAPGGPAAVPAPKPAPENDLIKKASGTWTCEGAAKGPDGQERKFKSTWTIKPTLGGHWYAVVYKRSKSGPLPPFEGNAIVGYNAADKKYAFVGFDNMGNWVNLSSSDAAVYTGEGSPMGRRGPVTFTFTPGKDKKGQESDRAFDVTLDFGMASSSESCKK